MWPKNFILLILCSGLSLNDSLAAPPKGSKYLDSSQIYQTTINGTLITCGNLPPWAPGRIVKGYFFPTSTEIKDLKKKIKSANSSKKPSLLKQLAKKKNYLNVGKSSCSQSGGGSTGNFDSFGNLTQSGKAVLQIPSTITKASVLDGLGVWKYKCQSCHAGTAASLPLKKYQEIFNRIQLSPMFFTVPGELSEQQLADLVAAVNY